VPPRGTPVITTASVLPGLFAWKVTCTSRVSVNSILPPRPALLAITVVLMNDSKITSDSNTAATLRTLPFIFMFILYISPPVNAERFCLYGAVEDRVGITFCIFWHNNLLKTPYKYIDLFFA
jgi:hypothetical protein